MRRELALAAAALVALAGCEARIPTATETPPATAAVIPTPPAVMPSTTASSASTPPAPVPPSPTTVLLPGTFSSVPFPRPSGLPYTGGGLMTDGRYAVTAFSDGRDGHATVRLDLVTGASRTIDFPDGDFGGVMGLESGRLAVMLWSRTTRGEVYDYLIEDAASAERTAVDHSDAPGIFHGEGSPPQPDAGFILGPGRVAYNHLFVQGGALWVQLRVGKVGEPMAAVTTTTDTIMPVALGPTALAYVVMARNGEEQLRLYDIASRRDTLVTRGLLFFEAVLNTRQLLYYARPYDGSAGRVVLRDLASGSERTVMTGSCASPSLNERYGTITCGEGGATALHRVAMFDLSTLQSVDVARSADSLGNARMLEGAIGWDRFDGSLPPGLSIETLRY